MRFCGHLLVFVFSLSLFLTADELPNSDIVVFDVARKDRSIQLSNPQVIARSPGYDNQPQFGPDSETVYFTRIVGENADLWAWRPQSEVANLTRSPWSEYSPTVIPFAPKLLSTVVVEDGGTQRLWSYSPRAGFQVIFPDLQPVGYHVWSAEQVALFVLGEPHELRVGEWGSDITSLVDRDIGRCLQKVPGRHAASFTGAEGKQQRLKVYDFDSSAVTTLRRLPAGVQDYVWLNDTDILTWDGESLVQGDAGGSDWVKVSAPFELKGVSRLAMSPDGKRLAVVYEPD